METAHCKKKTVEEQKLKFHIKQDKYKKELLILLIFKKYFFKGKKNKLIVLFILKD